MATSKTKKQPKPELTGNAAALSSCCRSLYSLASRLRTVEWGEGSRRPIDSARYELGEVVDELRMLHLAFPVGPEYLVAMQLARARDEWELCKDGVVAFNPDTYLEIEFYGSADDVPAGKAVMTVRKWSTTNMGEYEKLDNGAPFDRLDGLAEEVKDAVAKARAKLMDEVDRET